MRLHPRRPVTALLFATAACAAGCGRSAEPESAPEEAWDSANRPQILGLSSRRYEELAGDAASGVIDARPWRDSYWPFQKQNLAWRYQQDDAQAFDSADAQVADALADPELATLSPAEKYDLVADDAGFPLTRHGWSLYERYHGIYGDDDAAWSWMGICSGWAPASISEAAPRSHVLAITPSGRRVLFLRGDLRGLLSKVYDLNAMTAADRLVGTRCDRDDADVPRDASGRPVDGRFTAGGQLFVIRTDRAESLGVLEVRALDGEATTWLVADARFDRMQGRKPMWRYARRADVLADIAADRRGAHADSAAREEVELYRSCRDANPASLHLALAGLVHGGVAAPQGVIFEMNRGPQVWNHPVVGYTSRLGAPLPLAADAPARRAFRAPGTTHVADVVTSIVYVPGYYQPRAEEAHDDHAPIDLQDLDAVRRRFLVGELRYSLELDAAGYVIGGEWQETESGGGTMPDFFWRPYGRPTDRTKAGAPSPIKYSVVGALAACSRREADQTYAARWPDGGTRSIPVATCRL